jgi:hypothetical protein
MGSKRFKGKLCVYCSERPAITGDHIFAREFFVSDARADLPQVPACDQCNNEKSKLEHYLTAVLPFGGRHPQATENLAELVPGRLEKNQRLAQELRSGMSRFWHVEGHTVSPSIAVPIDPDRLCELFAQIGRGLAWYHWGTYLQGSHTSKAIMLSSAGRSVFDSLFAMNVANRVRESLGKATVTYSGVQAVDPPQLTCWRVQFYGGMALTGDPESPGVVSTEIGVVTGSQNIVHRFLQGGIGET